MDPLENSQKFQEFTRDPNTTLVKGELLNPYGLKMKNQKPLLISRHPKNNFDTQSYKNQKLTSRTPMTMKLIFSESRQVILMFRLKNQEKTHWYHYFLRLTTRSKFCTAETS